MAAVSSDTLEQKTQSYRLRAKRLYEQQQTWRPVWKEISEYMMPYRGRYLTDEQEEANRGERKDRKIINGSASDAIRIIAAGLQGGLTSPSRPWFILTIDDKELMEFYPVKTWLHTVRNRMLSVISRTNFYGSVHGMYAELAGFGTSATIIEEDFQTVFRCRPLSIGEYTLGLDANYRPNTLYRRDWMSAAQLVSMFGKENVSDSVKECFSNPGTRDKLFQFQHCIHPNSEVDPIKADYRGMSFKSVYYEIAGDPNKFLRTGGYRGIPFIAPRWDVVAVDTYGICPGRDAIGDVKMLQKLEEKKLRQIDKHTDPAMNAPTSMRKKGGTIISGGVNYLDIQQGQQTFSPAYQTNPDIRPVAAEINTVENRIRRFFFNDLFLTILSADKNMTATEVARRHEEKLLMLGPVMERLQAEMHDPTLDRIYNIMDDLGLIPPAPKELQGAELKVQYLGLLAQAQKIVSLQSVQQTAQYVAGLAQVWPEARDKFNADQSIDEFADANGTPPDLILSDDAVAEVRAQRAQREAAIQAQVQASAAAETGKTLSETQVKGKSALDRVAEQAGVR